MSKLTPTLGMGDDSYQVTFAPETGAGRRRPRRLTKHTPPLFSRSWLLRISTLALLLFTVAAHADKSDIGRQYNGGFLAPGIFAGIEVLDAPSWDQRVGWMTGVYARTASVLSVFDIQLEYTVAGHTLREGPHRAQMVRHSASSSLNLHPFFTRLIAADYLSRVLSAFYVQLGLSAEFMSMSSGEKEFTREEVAFSLHWGAGFDVPLGNPNGTGAFWLGLNWRWKFVYADPAFYGHDNTHAHQLALVLTYRFNNISFTRVDRPDELQWRP